MNISPDLAAKVLDADLRNIVKKVSDGGILSPSERGLLQNAAFPENHMKASRVLALALKYSTGARLTSGELAEVREIHPGFAPEPAPQESAPADIAPPPSPALRLSPEPSPSAGDGEITRAQLDRWSEMYGVEHRQLRRWVARGREKNDPCPLDRPELMPAWVDKHLERIRAAMRERVGAAAQAAQSRLQPSPPDEQQPPSVSAPPVAAIAPLDLARVGGVEGESVDIFRRLFAAVKTQLEDAYLGGSEERIRTLHARLEKIGESLRKHEVAAEARARRIGDYLEKSEVFSEVMSALNTLALMREHRCRRVQDELSDLPPDLIDRIVAVLNRAGAAEESVLRNLSAIKRPSDVFEALVA